MEVEENFTGRTECEAEFLRLRHVTVLNVFRRVQTPRRCLRLTCIYIVFIYLSEIWRILQVSYQLCLKDETDPFCLMFVDSWVINQRMVLH